MEVLSRGTLAMLHATTPVAGRILQVVREPIEIQVEEMTRLHQQIIKDVVELSNRTAHEQCGQKYALDARITITRSRAYYTLVSQTSFIS
jgi:hypothetical protein